MLKVWYELHYISCVWNFTKLHWHIFTFSHFPNFFQPKWCSALRHIHIICIKQSRQSAARTKIIIYWNSRCTLIRVFLGRKLKVPRLNQLQLQKLIKHFQKYIVMRIHKMNEFNALHFYAHLFRIFPILSFNCEVNICLCVICVHNSHFTHFIGSRNWTK